MFLVVVVVGGGGGGGGGGVCVCMYVAGEVGSTCLFQVP